MLAMIRFVALVAGLQLAAQGATAATYAYAGNAFDSTFSQYDSPVVDGSYSGANSVSGSFSLDGLLAADMGLSDVSGLLTSFSFTDGNNSFTEANTLVGSFWVRTVAGHIADWSIQLLSKPMSDGSGGASIAGLVTRTFVPGYGPLAIDRGFEIGCAGGICNTVFGAGYQSAHVTDPGTWTVSAVPLPATGVLLAAAIGLLGAGRLRRRVAA